MLKLTENNKFKVETLNNYLLRTLIIIYFAIINNCLNNFSDFNNTIIITSKY